MPGESLAQLVFLNAGLDQNSASTARRLATRHSNARIVRNARDVLRKATTIAAAMKQS